MPEMQGYQQILKLRDVDGCIFRINAKHIVRYRECGAGTYNYNNELPKHTLIETLNDDMYARVLESVEQIDALMGSCVFTIIGKESYGTQNKEESENND